MIFYVEVIIFRVPFLGWLLDWRERFLLFGWLIWYTQTVELFTIQITPKYLMRHVEICLLVRLVSVAICTDCLKASFLTVCVSSAGLVESLLYSNPWMVFPSIHWFIDWLLKFWTCHAFCSLKSLEMPEIMFFPVDKFKLQHCDIRNTIFYRASA